MAEFSRRSGKRIIENIDTKKASKQEVFDFYKRSRAQLKNRGEKVEPLLKVKDVKKADIIRELERLERAERESSLSREYDRMANKIEAITPKQAEQKYSKFERRLQTLQERNLIDIKNVKHGTLDTRFKTEYKREVNNHPETVTKYKGRFAHDLIAKWVDEGKIHNTEDYEDSDEIWEFMDETTENAEEYDFFSEMYQGNNEVGDAEYYHEFQDFLQDSEDFEADLEAAGEDVPTYYTNEYWERLREWKESRNRML